MRSSEVAVASILADFVFCFLFFLALPEARVSSREQSRSIVVCPRCWLRIWFMPEDVPIRVAGDRKGSPLHCMYLE
jgi:hypothetical protein